MATQPDDAGFVKRGFLLLGGMTILCAVVLGIIFFKPAPPPAVEHKDLPAAASAEGWEIRYNATIALLRHGSDKVPWPLVSEMLDEKQQLKNNQFKAQTIVFNALKAVAEWTKAQAEAKKNVDDVASLAEIRARVDVLTASPFAGLRTQAEATKLALSK